MTSTNTQVDRLKQMLSLEQRRLDLQGELDSLAQELGNLKKRLFDDGGPVAKATVTNVAPIRGGTRKRAFSGTIGPHENMKLSRSYGKRNILKYEFITD